MNISDLIEQFILSTLGDDESLNISRNELANYFAVAPSQINYVLSTRFTTDRGYAIESRRGGGGSVTVMRVNATNDDVLQELLNLPISEGLNFTKACHILDRLEEMELLSEKESDLMRACLTDKALVAPTVAKDNLRVGLLKAMVTELLKRES